MKFYNNLNKNVATVFVYKQEDWTNLIAAWQHDVYAGSSAVYKPTWGDDIKYKAKVTVAGFSGEVHWKENLKDDGQWIKIIPDGDYGFKLKTGND